MVRAVSTMDDDDDDDESPHVRETRQFNPRDMIGWPIALTALEHMGQWTILALRLGTLALLQECVRAMAMPKASGTLVDRAKELLEALAKMPWDP